MIYFLANILREHEVLWQTFQLTSGCFRLSKTLRLTNGIIFMQPGAGEEEEMYAEALTYIQAAPKRVIPKIPIFRFPTVVKICYTIELMGDGVPWLRATS